MKKPLRAKADGQAGDARARQQRPDVHAQSVQDFEERPEDDQGEANAVDHAGHRAELLRARRLPYVLPVGELNETPGGAAQQPHQHDGDDDIHEDLRRLVLQELERLVVPVFEQLLDFGGVHA